MSMQNHYYVLTMSFFVRRHSTQFQERLKGTFGLSTYVALSFIGILLFSFHYETTTEAKYIFLRKREWEFNLKNMKISWIRMVVKLEKLFKCQLFKVSIS